MDVLVWGVETWRIFSLQNKNKWYVTGFSKPMSHTCLFYKKNCRSQEYPALPEMCQKNHNYDKYIINMQETPAYTQSIPTRKNRRFILSMQANCNLMCICTDFMHKPHLTQIYKSRLAHSKSWPCHAVMATPKDLSWICLPKLLRCRWDAASPNDPNVSKIWHVWLESGNGQSLQPTSSLGCPPRWLTSPCRHGSLPLPSTATFD